MSDEKLFDNDFGPVVYLVVEFEREAIGADGFRRLLGSQTKKREGGFSE